MVEARLQHQVSYLARKHVKCEERQKVVGHGRCAVCGNGTQCWEGSFISMTGNKLRRCCTIWQRGGLYR